MQGTRDTLEAIVGELRSDDAVLDALYRSDDATVPAAVEDRDRIKPGAIPKELDTPVRIVVNVAVSAGEGNKSAVSRTMLVDLAVVATHDWFKEHQHLAFLDIADAVDGVGMLSPQPGLSALGLGSSGGSGDGIQVEEETGRRVITSSYQFRSYGTRY